MRSESVVPVEPAAECGGSLAARAVDGAVGPAVDEGADKTFGFPVRARPVRPGAQVADAERLAGKRVHDRAVAGAVICEHPLDPDPVAAKEGDRPAQEADCGRCFLVGEHLDVGEPGRVVDGHVHELPADPARPGATVAVDAMAGPAILPSFSTSMWTSSPGRGRW